MTQHGAADVDDALELLADPIRRQVVLELHGESATEATAHTVATLSRTIERGIATERRRTESNPGGCRERVGPVDVRTTRVHVHLPRLDATECIDRDRTAGTVEPAEGLNDVVSYLRLPEETRARDELAGE